jgi:predicted permease
MIYFADVAGDLDWFLGAIFIIALITFVCCLGASFLLNEEGADEKAWAIWREATWRSGLTLVASFVIGGALPSQETVYAIAASELGETALKSETGNKAVEALNAWLDRQIGGVEEKVE